MGEALLSRLLSADIYKPTQIQVSDPSEARRAALADYYGVAVTADNQALVNQCDVLLLAVKPQIFQRVVPDLQAATTPCLLLSIMAGVTLSQLQQAVPDWPVVRAMPNTPATVGAGMTAIAAGTHVQPSQLTQAHHIFGAVGQVVEVSESLMDAVTGLSGSGPAYVALMVEALADGGVAVGLPRAIAAQLALQTVLGTAQLMAETNLHPALLKDQVASPGGTTIAGVAQLERSGLRSALIEAVQAACARSKALGNG